MQNVPILELQEIAGGALQEVAQDAIAKVLANLQDVNTPWKAKRMVTIKLGFTQNEERNDVTMTISAVPGLAPVKPVEAKFAIGKDLRNGCIYIEEYGPQIKGQMTLGDYMAVPQAVETDAGTNKVTDFRVKEA